MHKEVLLSSVQAYKMAVLAISVTDLRADSTGLSPSELLPSGRKRDFVLQL